MPRLLGVVTGGRAVNAPMTDERLAELHGVVDRAWGLSIADLRDAVIELDRLRAALAARPKPIGYVRITRSGTVDYQGFMFRKPPPIDRGQQVCALVPVEATP